MDSPSLEVFMAGQGLEQPALVEWQGWNEMVCKAPSNPNLGFYKKRQLNIPEKMKVVLGIRSFAELVSKVLSISKHSWILQK